MTKKEIIERASKISGIPQSHIHECLEAILKVVLEALSEKKRVTLHNFGTFFTKDLNPHIAMNPREGKRISLDARSIVKLWSQYFVTLILAMNSCPQNSHILLISSLLLIFWE